MPAVNWLDRRIAYPGPYLALCLTEKAFRRAMKHCGVKDQPDWVSSGPASACVHPLQNKEGKLACVVCMRDWAGKDPIEVAGLLVHEAVHVWQKYAERIGEHSPGVEQEAYAIQAISQELMAEFVRQTS